MVTWTVSRPLMLSVRNNMSSIILRCPQRKILFPLQAQSVTIPFSQAKFIPKPRQTNILPYRTKYNSLTLKYVNKPVLLLVGGLCISNFKITNQLKYFKVLCEDSSTSYETARKHNFNKKFILLRWISNLIFLIRIILRALKLLVTFSPILILYPFTILSKKLKIWWWQLMLLAFEFSGPAFVKFGQWASTRRDLFSKEFCDRFSKLHHHAKAHSWHHTKVTLQKAYGKKWREILLFENNAQPIGSGCVAQVYKAYVREDKLNDVELEQIQEDIHEQEVASDMLIDQKTFAEGVSIKSLELFKNRSLKSAQNSTGDTACTEPLDLVTEPGNKAPDCDYGNLIQVAIKVLHPGVRDTFARDLTLMSAMASCIQFIIPSLRWLSLTECVAEFATSMKKQMNMKHEARCMDRLVQSFSQDQNVRIPIPLWPLITRDVLVETFEGGEPISNFLHEGDEHANSLRRKLAELGVNALLEMVFVNNFVHCDLHPGNILVQNAEDFKENVEDQLVVVNVGDAVITGITKPECPVKLVFLDCGITATLSENDRIKFRDVFTAVVKGEGEAVADLFLTRTAHVECTDPDAFRKDMSAVVMQAREETLSLSQINVAALMSEVFRVLRTHKVKLESNFATVILAMAVLEGLGRSLDPELDILEKARPVLIHHTVFS